MCIVYSISMPKTFWFSGDRVHCQVVRLGGQWVDPETVGVRIYFGQDGCIGRDISSKGWFGSFRFLSSFLNYPYHMGIVVTKTSKRWIKWDYDSWKDHWQCQAHGRLWRLRLLTFDARNRRCGTWGRERVSWKKIWPEIEDESLVVIPKSQGRTALQEVQDKIQRLKEARKSSTLEEDSANTALKSSL